MVSLLKGGLDMVEFQDSASVGYALGRKWALEADLTMGVTKGEVKMVASERYEQLVGKVNLDADEFVEGFVKGWESTR